MNDADLEIQWRDRVVEAAGRPPRPAGARAWIVVGLVMGMLRGQQGDGWQQLGAGHSMRMVAVVGARAQAISVVWPHEFRRDPGAEKALALAVAAFRLERARAELPAGAIAGVEVLDGMTLYHLRLPVGSAVAAAWLRGLYRVPDLGADLARLQLVAARSALSADDASWLFPGEVLQSRARIALASGSVGGAALRGRAGFLQACSPQQLAEAVGREPDRPLRVVVVGDLGGVEPLQASLAAIVPRGDGGGHRLSLAVEAAFSIHPRVDGAFVAAAVATPRPGAATIPFALGAELVRARATRHFGSYRGGEAAAQAPFVAYSYLTGSPVLVVCRRGPDLVAGDRPRAEIAELLRSGRDDPPTAGELRSAARRLHAEWSVPPWTARQLRALGENPEGLAPRARSLALLGHWRIADVVVRELDSAVSGVEGVDKVTVHAVLQQVFEPARVWWGGLDPRPSSVDSRWR